MEERVEVVKAPLILLDCTQCAGFTRFDQHSATRVACRECGYEQENERLVDLNELRV